MIAALLCFVAAFVGTVVLIREARRPEWNLGWLWADYLTLWVWLAGALALLVRWATT